MFAIVVVCYNRLDGMLRTLESVKAAQYMGDDVALIVSIDKSDKQDVLCVAANRFEWPFGPKVVRRFPERQGLRAHVLQCGDLTDNYEAVIVLEDDITVAEGFYSYTKQTVDFYGNNESIFGISLYAHQTNPGCQRPFFPAANGYDTYLMQYAQSWGQCWTSNMWRGFRDWYSKQKGDMEADGIIPQYIANWNDKSWLKYYIKYTVEKNGYFVYPYASLSTNNSDKGEHCTVSNNDYQVTMLEGCPKYRFPTMEQAVKYDVYYERIIDQENIFPEIPGKRLLDLYGMRTDFGDADVLISTQSLPYQVLRSIQLKYRPHEANCRYPVDGDGIFIYDLHQKAQPPKSDKHLCIRYDVRSISWRMLMLEVYEQASFGLCNKIGNIFKRE